MRPSEAAVVRNAPKRVVIWFQRGHRGPARAGAEPTGIETTLAVAIVVATAVLVSLPAPTM